MTPRSSLATIALLVSSFLGPVGCAARDMAPAPAMAVAARAPGGAHEAAAPAAQDVAPTSVAAGALASPAPAQVPGKPQAPASAKPDAARAAKTAPARAAVIIYQGDLRMMADEAAIPKTIDAIVDVAESLGGHIAGRKDASVVVKVPSASFREALTKIDALGGVVSRSVSADDVSEEFHDLEVRLGNLKATRARLQEFLAKASAIPDMLTVERELERVALEIDRIEGRLEFLRTRAALSAITVNLAAKPKDAPIATAPPPPSSPRAPTLPIPWVKAVGLDPLISLSK